MKYTFTEHITAIYLRFYLYMQIIKDVLFIMRKRSVKPVIMAPFDPRLAQQADNIIQKIRKATPALYAQLLGSTRLKIYGKRDIDIYIECPPSLKEQSVITLSKHFGKPSQTGVVVGWSFVENGAEIEIVLIDPRSLYYQVHVYMMSLLTKNPKYLAAYINLKKRHNMLQRKIYSRNKTLFINAMLFRHIDDFISEYIQKARKYSDDDTHGNTAPVSNMVKRSKRAKPTVMIGITAYNEEKNILRILSQITAQKQYNYSLLKIVVLSDASKDRTDSIVSTCAFDNVELVRNTKNIGKTASVITLLKQAKRVGAELTILIDADLYMSDTMTISNLVNPFIEDDTMMTVSGNTLPMRPKGYIEHIAYFTDLLSRDTYRRYQNNINYYTCTDQLIALKTAHYSRVDLTKYSFLHDGAYYLLTVMANKKYMVALNAVAHYQLPTILQEYVSQMSRFLITDKQIENEFHTLNLSTFQHIHAYKKIRSFIHLSIRQPLIAIGCLGIHALIHSCKLLGISLFTYHAAWDTQQSTKFPRTIETLPIIRSIRNQSKGDSFTLVVRQEPCGVKYVEKTYKGLFFMPTYRHLKNESVITRILRTRARSNAAISVPTLLYVRSNFTSFTAYYEYLDGKGIQTVSASKQMSAFTTVRTWARQTIFPYTRTMLPHRYTAYFALRILPMTCVALIKYPDYVRQWFRLLLLVLNGLPTISSLHTSIVHGDLAPENMIQTKSSLYLIDISMASISYSAVEAIRILTNNASPAAYKHFAGTSIIWDKNTKALAAYYFLADAVFNHANRKNLAKIDSLMHAYL